MKPIIDELQNKIQSIFEHLHENPEISWEEVETTAYIKELLKGFDCRIQTFKDSTGLVAEMGEGKPVIGIRADMDALWQEVDGKFCANHSCGHDAHMTMALGVFFTLQALKERPKGTIRFIFQPAEETGMGAIKLNEYKVVEDVDYLYGVHLRPIQELKDGLATPAIMHGAACFIKGMITGEDAHAARPHLGTNAIEVGASIVQLLNNLHFNPLVPHSIKMTSFEAGGKSANIIPGSARFSLDLRAQTNEVMGEMMKSLENIVDHIQNIYGVKIEIKVEANLAAAIVNEEAKEIMTKAICDVLGTGCLRPALATAGGEDFHFYTLKNPRIKGTMLGLGCDLSPGLHHPKMTFNREAIFHGIEILTTAILYSLREGVSN